MTNDQIACLREAEAGNVRACFHLGLMYGLGVGIERDFSAAIDWYRRAALAGFGRAQTNLGWMFGTGRGVPQDYVSAWAWYSIAAAGGEDVARKNRDTVEARMSTSQLEQAQSLARELFSQLKERGG